jgi:hypothetical protein
MTSTSIEISFIPDDDHIDEALLIFASPSADMGGLPALVTLRFKKKF